MKSEAHQFDTPWKEALEKYLQPCWISVFPACCRHRPAQQTQRKTTERFDRKWDLTRRLYDLGLDKPGIWELYRLIAWLMWLPEPLEKDFKQRMFG